MPSIFSPKELQLYFFLINKEFVTLMARPNSEKGILSLFFIFLTPQIPPLTSDRPSTFAMLKITQIKTSDFASNNSLGKKKKKEEKSKKCLSIICTNSVKPKHMSSEYRLIFCVIYITKKKKPIELICWALLVLRKCQQFQGHIHKTMQKVRSWGQWYFSHVYILISDLKDTTSPPPKMKNRNHCLPVGVCPKRTLLPTCKSKKNNRREV